MSTAVQTYKPNGPEFDPDTNEPNRNWTKTHNKLVEKLPAKVSGKLQLLLILHIARNTWGRHPPEPWTRFTHQKLAKQFSATRVAITKVVEDAVERKLLEVQRQSAKRINYRVAKWDNVLPYEPEKLQQNTATSPEHRMNGMIFPGRGSAWIQLPLPIGQDPKPLKVYNHVNQPVAFRLEETDEGFKLHILTSNAGKEDAKSQVKLNGTLVTPVYQYSDKSFPVNTNNDQKNSALSRFQVPADYREFLRQLWLDVWERAISDKEIRSILRHVKGASVDYFVRQLAVRFGEKYRQALAKHNPRLIVNHVAVDVGNNWRATDAFEKENPPRQESTGMVIHGETEEERQQRIKNLDEMLTEGVLQ